MATKNYAPRHIMGIEVGKTTVIHGDELFTVTIEKFYTGNDVLRRVNTDGQGKPAYIFVIDKLGTNCMLHTSALKALNAAKREINKELA